MDVVATAMIAVALCVLVGLLLPVPIVAHARGLARHRTAWLSLAPATGAAGGGIYRTAALRSAAVIGPPRIVHVAAFTCFVFGQLFIPWLVPASLGTGVLLIGLFDAVSRPSMFGTFLVGSGFALAVVGSGLVAAWRLFNAGTLLLRGARAAGPCARVAAYTAAAHSAILLAIAAVGAAYSVGGTGWVLVVLAYVAAALGQAAVLLRAARVVERYPVVTAADIVGRGWAVPRAVDAGPRA